MRAPGPTLGMRTRAIGRDVDDEVGVEGLVVGARGGAPLASGTRRVSRT